MGPPSRAALLHISARLLAWPPRAPFSLNIRRFPSLAHRSAKQAEEHAKQVAEALAEAQQAKLAERDESRGTGTQAT
jgi:hypothetical protein